MLTLAAIWLVQVIAASAAAGKRSVMGAERVGLGEFHSTTTDEELLTHFDFRCPSWYAEHEYQEFCEYLEREYGISYEDWCLEMRIESPMREPVERTAGPPQQFEQLYLPGLSPEPRFTIESY